MNAARPTQRARTDVTAMSLGIFVRPGTRHRLLAVIYSGNLCVFNVTGHAVTRTIPPCTARQETAAIDGDRAITEALRQGSRLSWRLLSTARSIPGRAPRRPICSLTLSAHRNTLCHQTVLDCSPGRRCGIAAVAGVGGHASGALATLAIVGKIDVFAAQGHTKWSVSTFGYALVTNN